MKSVLNIHWKNWCWSWSSNTVATWCEELTHLKRPWCWERLKAGGEGDDKGWDGWMASLTQWAWLCASSGRCWRTGKLCVLQSMGLNELDMTEWLNNICIIQASQVVLVVKSSPANAGDVRDRGLIPGLRRSPGEGNGNPLPYPG